MFDFDAGKLMIIAAVALVVIGPKDLPRVLRQIGQMVSKVRRMAGEFQGQFMEAMKEADIQDIRDEVAKIKTAASVDLDFNPARDIKTELDEAIKPRAGKSFPIMPSGSTSETHPINLPASSEIHDGPVAVDASVSAPADEAASPPDEIAPYPIEALSPRAPEEVGPRPKVVITRRRIASRFDLASLRAPQRSRNIFPARRETPES